MQTDQIRHIYHSCTSRWAGEVLVAMEGADMWTMEQDDAGDIIFVHQETQVSVYSFQLERAVLSVRIMLVCTPRKSSFRNLLEAGKMSVYPLEGVLQTLWCTWHHLVPTTSRLSPSPVTTRTPTDNT